MTDNLNVLRVVLKQWCKDVVHAPSGLFSYLEHEEEQQEPQRLYGALKRGGASKDPDHDRCAAVYAVAWALRCLANPKYRAVLDAVVEQSDLATRQLAEDVVRAKGRQKR